MRFPTLCITLATIAASSSALAQNATVAAPAAAAAPTAVPALVPYSGTAIAGNGRPLTGETTMTFLLFKDQEGGDALWSEAQAVAVDDTGHYRVQLGAASPVGMPLTTFISGEGRWLEVQIAGLPPQPRVFLTSVPYAMKAADASTLGGLPASAYALAGSGPAAGSATSTAATPDTSSTVNTPGGTAGYLPVFSASTTIDDSLLFQSGTKIGIGNKTPAATLDVSGTIDARGELAIEDTGAASSSSGKDSFPLSFVASAYNSSSKAATYPQFQFQAEPSGNNTTTPTATLNLLSANGTTPSETGLYFTSKGLIHFAPGQTFPGSGTGTITGVTAGTDLTGGGTSGNVTLNLNTSKLITGVSAGSGLVGGGTAGTVSLAVDTTKIPTLTDNPTFTGTITANSKTAGKPAVAANGTSGGIGVYATSDTAWAGRFTNAGTSYASIYSTSISASDGWAFYGTTTGKGGEGVYAEAEGLDSYGVVANADAAGSYGLYAQAGGGFDSSGNPSIGVSGNTNDGFGVQGNATNGVGVEGTATTGFAVEGHATTGLAGAFFDQSTTGVALYANNAANVTGGSGIYPTAIQGNASGTLGIGVEGYAFLGTGVLGIGEGQSNVATSFLADGITSGTWGDTAGTYNSVGDIGGVVGTADDNHAAYFINNSNTFTTLAIETQGSGGSGLFKTVEASSREGTCGFGGAGDMTCTGQVKTLASTGGGSHKVETYAMQSPENWMEDFGSATLSNGVAIVTIDPAFAETANTGAAYHVFLTPSGDSKGLYVVAKSATTFEVHEASGGTSSLAFDYRIVAKRRGYEAERLVDVTETFNAETATPNRHFQMAPAANSRKKPAIVTPTPKVATPRPPQVRLQGATAPVAAAQTQHHSGN